MKLNESETCFSRSHVCVFGKILSYYRRNLCDSTTPKLLMTYEKASRLSTGHYRALSSLISLFLSPLTKMFAEITAVIQYEGEADHVTVVHKNLKSSLSPTKTISLKFTFVSNAWIFFLCILSSFSTSFNSTLTENLFRLAQRFSFKSIKTRSAIIANAGKRQYRDGKSFVFPRW